VSSPSGVRVGAPAARFWRILKATELSFSYLYDKIWGGGICISVPLLKILGGLVPPCSPRDLRPWVWPVEQPVWHWLKRSVGGYGRWHGRWFGGSVELSVTVANGHSSDGLPNYRRLPQTNISLPQSPIFIYRRPHSRYRRPILRGRKVTWKTANYHRLIFKYRRTPQTTTDQQFLTVDHFFFYRRPIQTCGKVLLGRPETNAD